MTQALSATPGVLSVELSPAAAMPGQPPAALTRDDAEVLASHLAEDLRRIFGAAVETGGLIVPGGLYDLTEMLRPGLPMTEALLDVYRGSLRGGAFQPQVIAIGHSGAQFPLPELAPPRRLPR